MRIVKPQSSQRERRPANFERVLAGLGREGLPKIIVEVNVVLLVTDAHCGTLRAEEERQTVFDEAVSNEPETARAILLVWGLHPTSRTVVFGSASLDGAAAASA